MRPSGAALTEPGTPLAASVLTGPNPAPGSARRGAHRELRARISPPHAAPHGGGRAVARHRQPEPGGRVRTVLAGIEHLGGAETPARRAAGRADHPWTLRPLPGVLARPHERHPAAGCDGGLEIQALLARSDTLLGPERSPGPRPQPHRKVRPHPGPHAAAGAVRDEQLTAAPVGERDPLGVPVREQEAPERPRSAEAAAGACHREAEAIPLLDEPRRSGAPIQLEPRDRDLAGRGHRERRLAGTRRGAVLRHAPRAGEQGTRGRAEARDEPHPRRAGVRVNARAHPQHDRAVAAEHLRVHLLPGREPGAVLDMPVGEERREARLGGAERPSGAGGRLAPPDQRDAVRAEVDRRPVDLRDGRADVAGRRPRRRRERGRPRGEEDRQARRDEEPRAHAATLSRPRPRGNAPRQARRACRAARSASSFFSRWGWMIGIRTRPLSPPPFASTDWVRRVPPPAGSSVVGEDQVDAADLGAALGAARRVVAGDLELAVDALAGDLEDLAEARAGAQRAGVEPLVALEPGRPARDLVVVEEVGEDLLGRLGDVRRF